MKKTAPEGRVNQRRRTRKDLLLAAGRLMKQGRRPTLEEVAAEAMISRATAYRYFPNIETLYLEASIDLELPTAEQLFGPDAPQDVLARVERADAALDDMIAANEPILRVFLAQSIAQRLKQQPDAAVPARQNRRTPLIEAALLPARRRIKPAALDLLTKALAIVIGTEAHIVTKDVLQLDLAEARKVRRWAIRALLDAAQK